VLVAEGGTIAGTAIVGEITEGVTSLDITALQEPFKITRIVKKTRFRSEVFMGIPFNTGLSKT
jgi:hypothetical protein